MPGTGSAENLKRKPRQYLIDDRGGRILVRLVNSDRKAPLHEITARFRRFSHVYAHVIRFRHPHGVFTCVRVLHPSNMLNT